MENNIIKFKVEFIKNQKSNEIEMNFKENKIICLSDGNNMTKIIVDNYLKTNLNIDEQTEIKLSKEYDVLSKNTSLFAEIENENSQHNKLIKINVLSSVNYYNQNKYNNSNYISSYLGNYDEEEDLNEINYFDTSQIVYECCEKDYFVEMGKTENIFSYIEECNSLPPNLFKCGIMKKRGYYLKEEPSNEKISRKREKSVDKSKEEKKERKKKKRLI